MTKIHFRSLRQRYQALAESRRLRRELATYTSPHQIEELLVILDRTENADSDPRVESMRRVLHDNLWRYEQHRSLAS